MLFENDELDVLFTIVLMNMKKDFLKKIVDEYRINLNWRKILEILDAKNNATLSFYRKSNDLIFRFDDIISMHVYEFRQLYLS